MFNMTIDAISAFNDNYIWVLVNRNQSTALVVDPGDAAPVIKHLTQQRLKLQGILITHHHGDHIGGVAELVRAYSVPVYGPRASPFQGVTSPVGNNDKLDIDGFPRFQVLSIPGHTLDHIAYYHEDILFCGDTLFAGGCGRLFEGTAEQLYGSLQHIAQLPLTTKIYCAHEYTLNNLRFAHMVEPSNVDILQRIEEVMSLRARHQPSLPSILNEEMRTNPFLRCDIPEVVKQAELYEHRKLMDPVEVFTVLRQWKNQF